MSDLIRISRLISCALRHKPEVLGLKLDSHGWADVNELIAGISQRQPFNRKMLDEIVATDNKQRYSYSDDGKRIRANQGHSIPVDVELEEAVPPETLLHGTGEKYTGLIDAQGLKPQQRLYVHLSKDRETALNVGQRHGKPALYLVRSGQMHRDGYRFYLSANGVWLTERVPPIYLERQPANKIDE